MTLFTNTTIVLNILNGINRVTLEQLTEIIGCIKVYSRNVFPLKASSNP